MDRITKKLFEDYCKEYELTDVNDANNFEKFCNYIVVSNEHNRTFDIDSISTGGGNDMGIDGVAILVNGSLIETSNEFEDYITDNKIWDVTFIFIQSKRSSSFKSSEVRTFFEGIVDFFDENSCVAPQNPQIKDAIDTKEAILDNAAKFKENPTLKIYYITTGKYNPEDKHLQNVTKKYNLKYEEMNLFSNIVINYVDSRELCSLYRKTKAELTASFVFSSKVTLPDVAGINQSYSGMLPFSEFKHLLLDENNNLKNVFDDNVRDFMGTKTNNVNKGISETLHSPNPHIFSVLNNGITVVANSITTSGNNFTITDYQIVNGCQTSNVLYECRKMDLDNIHIPLRLIVTDKDEIKSQITLSTNTQTAIKKEQLIALSSFQKTLEEYYDSITIPERLYYERRSKQFATKSSIKKNRIITLANQIKSFSSMHFADPHLVTTYFGKKVDKIQNEFPDPTIFNEEHSFAPYYLSGLAYYKLDTLFTKQVINKRYKKVRFYILMLIPYIVTGDKLPTPKKQKKSEQACEQITKILADENKCTDTFNKAISIINLSGAQIDDKESLKSIKMTNQILDEFNKQYRSKT